MKSWVFGSGHTGKYPFKQYMLENGVILVRFAGSSTIVLFFTTSQLP